MLWAIAVAIPLGGVAAAIAVEPDTTAVWGAVAGGAAGLLSGILFRRRLSDLVFGDDHGRPPRYAGHVAVVAVAYLVARQLSAVATATILATIAGLALAAATAGEGVDRAGSK